MRADGTYCPIYEPAPFSSRWYSHNEIGAGLRYEIVVGIFSGTISWVNGPFQPAVWTDLSILRNGTLNHVRFLEEVILAENVYNV